MLKTIVLLFIIVFTLSCQSTDKVIVKKKKNITVEDLMKKLTNAEKLELSTLLNKLKIELKLPVPKASELIIKAIKSENIYKKEAGIILSGEFKLKVAVLSLIKVLENQSEEQNIILNKQAAHSLTQIGDERAITPLIKASFIIKEAGKGNEGEIGKSAFVFARNALVFFGKPALKVILTTINGKNEEFNKF